ncbi:MAG TPA: hypothetical protein VKU93_01950 [Terracidiphilus sp.]|jgi:hypothetical protein|nr:hypothetical protein [Terracidiphilus sp.]
MDADLIDVAEARRSIGFSEGKQLRLHSKDDGNAENAENAIYEGGLNDRPVGPGDADLRIGRRIGVWGFFGIRHFARCFRADAAPAAAGR